MKLGVLSISHLVKQDVFEGPEHQHAIDLLEAKGMVRYDPAEQLVTVQISGTEIHALACRSKRTFGDRPFLLCQSCERRTSFLVLYDATAVCRQCVQDHEERHGLTKTPRVEIERMAAFAAGRLTGPDEQPRSSKAQRKRDRDAKRENDLLGTTQGLSRGRGAFQHNLVLRYLESTAPMNEGEIARYVCPAAPTPIVCVPSLDLKVLLRDCSQKVGQRPFDSAGPKTTPMVSRSCSSPTGASCTLF